MADSYALGKKVRCTVTFTDISGTPTDPTTVVARTRNPNGVTATPTATKSGTGIYYTDVTLDTRGTWTVRFEGTGTLVAANELQVICLESDFYS
jgi:hypothetical protein